MADHRPTRLAWTLCAAALALIALSMLLVALGWSTRLPREWGFSWQGMAVSSLGGVGAPVLGGLVASRRPANPYGWLWLGFGLGWGLLSLAQVYAAYALEARPGSLPAPLTVDTVLGNAGTTLWGTFVPLLLLLFPDGRPPSRRWRFLVPIVATAGAAGLFLGPFGPGRVGFAPVENPLSVGGAVGEVMAIVSEVGVVVTLGCILLSVLSLIFRYRSAGGMERQQIKWFAFAAVVFAGVIVLGQLVGRALPGVLDDLLYSAAVAGLYAAVGVAILRHRLYEIDRIINRTLVYGTLTVTLVSVYFGGVVSLQYALRALTGGGSPLVIVASTLAIAALFSPLRRRIQTLVDKRFYRGRYDAARTLEAFSARLREGMDLAALNDDVVGVIRETMQPEHAWLWLRPARGAGELKQSTQEVWGDKAS